MSIQNAPPISYQPALVREARSVFARALVLALAVLPVPVLSGLFGAMAALIGLALFAALLVVLERGIVPYHPHPRLGTANRITLMRGAIACVIAARAIEPASLGMTERWLLATIAVAALLLDGADGWAARRQGLASAFGARFDMEVDAFAILVLSFTVVRAEAVACWVLAIGAMRYLYLAAATMLPALRRPLPPRPIADRRRKTIAVIQSVAMVIALVPVTPASCAAAVCAVALGLLTYSFVADIRVLFASGISEVE